MSGITFGRMQGERGRITKFGVAKIFRGEEVIGKIVAKTKQVEEDGRKKTVFTQYVVNLNGVDPKVRKRFPIRKGEDSPDAALKRARAFVRGGDFEERVGP